MTAGRRLGGAQPGGPESSAGEPDGSCRRDAGSPPDGGPWPGGGHRPDAGSPPDCGHWPRGGPRPDGGSRAERRARRQLRWYPRSWRDRYGAEFTELLIAEIAEEPRSWRRALDVVRGGLLARCTVVGLTSHELPAREQFRASLAALCCASAVIGTLGLFMLAQLATGWQWTVTTSTPTTAGTLIMTVAAAGLALTGLAAALPAGWHAVRAAARNRDVRLALRLLLTVTCVVVLVVGTRHFQNGWPGTGGTGADRGLVPGGLAAFAWASTLSVSAYWVHPGLWGVFPAAEIAWIVLSPFAWAGLLAGTVGAARRLDPAPRLRAYLARLSVAAAVAAIGFVAGAGCWVLARGPAGTVAFRPGLIDAGGLAAMALAAAIALRAAATLQYARLRLSGSGPSSPG